MRKTIIFLACISLVLLIGCTPSSETEEGQQEHLDSEEQIELVEVDGEGNQWNLFVPSENDNIVTVIDLPSHEISHNIQVGERPANMVFIKELGKAFVTHRNGNSVGVIDLSSRKMTKEIAVGIDPHGISLSENEDLIYVTTVEDQYVYLIDPVEEEVVTTIDLGQGARTNYPYLHNDSLYVTDHVNHLVYAIKDEQVIDTYKVGGPPMVARTNIDGTLLYVASSSYGALEVFDVKTGNKLKDIPSGDGVTDFMISDGDVYLVATNMAEGSVSIIDLTNDDIVAKITDLSAPKHITFNEDESQVYFSLSGTNKIAAIDMKTMALVHEVEVGGKPHGVHLYKN